MSRDEIQKLIGGYASGSLTIEERRQLFEAALEDQDLFDALQEELALKELLDDPISREQIRRAAAESLPQPQVGWLRRQWIWAAGASVATAAVVLVVLVQWEQKPLEVKQVAAVHREAPVTQRREDTAVSSTGAIEPPVKTARKVERPPTPPYRALRATPKPANSLEKDAAVPAPPPAAPVQAESQTAQQQVIVSQAQPAPAPPSQAQDKTVEQSTEQQRPATIFRSQVRAKAAAGTGGAAGFAPPLALREMPIHSFARRLEDGSYMSVPPDTVFRPGDTIRLTVVPRVSGPLVVWQWDAKALSWRRLFPPERETLQVRALERYTVPLDIVVTNPERLRVTVAAVPSEIPVQVR